MVCGSDIPTTGSLYTTAGHHDIVVHMAGDIFTVPLSTLQRRKEDGVGTGTCVGNL